MKQFDYHGYFITPIYNVFLPEFVKSLNKASDNLIKKQKKKNILENKKTFKKDIGDLTKVHHSSCLINIKEFNEIKNFVLNQCPSILDQMGYDVSNHKMMMTEMWVQEFPEKGGGYHEAHEHSNNHISGFYFLKSSEKTSFPIFHDPRYGKTMMQLPEKNKNDITFINDSINYKVAPGTLILFPAFIKHSFAIDAGIEPFRFIHFNIQAINKNVF
jgi:uncharacterized protein (TIGR02466 family)